MVTLLRNNNVKLLLNLINFFIGGVIMGCSKEYLRLRLQFIRSRIIFNGLIKEFGWDHPKVIEYNNKINQLIDEILKKAGED